MQIFTLIKAVLGRTIVVVIVLLTVLWLGLTSDFPTYTSSVDTSVREIKKLVTTGEKISTTSPKIDTNLENIVEDSTKNTIVHDESIKETITRDVETSVELPIIEDTEPSIPFSEINTKTAEALVNVFCTQNTTGAVTPITGSGVIIDPRGIVITNAHVAQYFLLKDYPIENGLQCILRTSSPARARYTAELLYISPEWVNLHADDITSSEPKGTGEHDYAFLRITGRTDPNAELPTTFPFVPVDINDSAIKTGDHVLAAAYPAGFLGNISIQKDLYSVSSVATVGERFTFLENTIDLFSIGGTVVSQGGSSGGAVVSDTNKLIGIIVTSTQADTTSERDLRAITIGHVDRALTQNTNTTIEGLLFGDIVLKAKLFNINIAPALTTLFLQYLIK